jgi:protein-tyrosine phosphatase
MNIKPRGPILAVLITILVSSLSMTSLVSAASCGATETVIVACTDSSGIWGILLLCINILTSGIGIAAVGGIVYGSILYTSSGNDEARLKKAKEIIQNVIIGLIAYVSMYAVLQFIIPGGIFNTSLAVPSDTSSTNSSTSGSKTKPGTSDDQGSSKDKDKADITSINSVLNIRDASTSSGNVLKEGVLYRSAQLVRLNQKDAKTLKELLANGVIIDLRTDESRASDPDKPVSGVTKANIPIEGLLDTDVMVTDPVRRSQLAKALKTAANANGPVYVHCVAGKDRTGWMVAMIMYAVGANDTQVMREYLKSNEAIPGGVKPEWLKSGLQAARSEYGSIKGYLKAIGLTDGDLSKLKNKFGA